MPSLSSALARIATDAGYSYDCYCSRSLGFSISLSGEAIILGQPQNARRRQGREIIIGKGTTELGVIHRGRLLTLGDRLLLGDRTYRLPNVFCPRIGELGLTFSWLGLLGVGTHRVHVCETHNVDIAPALLGYLYARSVFVE